MRLVAVKHEDYVSNKVIKGVAGKYARQLICLRNSKLYELLQPIEPVQHRVKKDINVVDYMFGNVDMGNDVNVLVDNSLTDIVNDKSVFGLGVDILEFITLKDDLGIDILELGVLVFIYVEAKDLEINELKESIKRLFNEKDERVFIVLDVDIDLSDYFKLEDFINKELQSTKVRLIGKKIFKLGGTSCGGMIPSWLAKKYKLDFNFNYVHDTTQVALLAEDFDYLDLDQDKVYSYNNVKDKR